MYFERKAYQKLLDWKNRYADRYAVLLEGARRVGKSTIAQHFAEKEYDAYLLIDFSNASGEVLACFDDIGDLDLFFLRLQAATGVSLIVGHSVVIFDEVQLFPKARQAIKHLVKDGRYHYIETGSLISIRKNVRDILIPSEEMKIQIYPMDYEEFCLVSGSQMYALNRKIYETGKPIGQTIRKIMRDFRIYMAVGGMPQAVEAYTEGKNFAEIDRIKREIIGLYEEDFQKIDATGRTAKIFHAIPAQLARDVRRFYVPSTIGRMTHTVKEEMISELIDSKTVLFCSNSTDPRVSLSASQDLDSYKLYIADTGLFVTLLFMDRPEIENVLYTQLLSDKLPANLGYLYENVVAQMLAASGRELYYHTWKKKNSTHYYEIDFLFTKGTKVSAIEVKSSGTGRHASLNAFKEKWSASAGELYVLSQKDVSKKEGIHYLPICFAPYLFEA
ncbi:ATP-binding protein [Pseudoramibacter porci]|uniref:ATP-binding protein n=1 Tax=Pseudoramibacter porci TaxID=2606631 RepID=A0A7X2NG63_9FIRM|nr:AAA family ATPase [Pseudoramibacter porci]MSS19820.1 ATP-binding protein [Pseudoramibacter porci]